jgi:hypothetical protein
MTEPAAQLYTLSGATGEIFIMLLVSFVLGALLGRVLASSPQGESATPLAQPTRLKKDDLKVVEGIGPAVEALLYKNGILTWQMLSQTPTERLTRILTSAGGPFMLHNPSTWSEQASLAARGKWEELKALQEALIGGIAPRA